MSRLPNPEQKKFGLVDRIIRDRIEDVPSDSSHLPFDSCIIADWERRALAMVEGTSTLAVHRCRFVDYTPSAVTALCFPPLPLPSVKGKKAATNKGFPGFGPFVVGRANGNIELCEWTGPNSRSQAPQAWVVRKVCTYALFSNVL